ncbi:MAG: hypothetical protein M1308_19710 [Actinobacteria bacterium]|nr:hypothetical protein [Actinomycetota bacterium]
MQVLRWHERTTHGSFVRTLAEKFSSECKDGLVSYVESLERNGVYEPSTGNVHLTESELGRARKKTNEDRAGILFGTSVACLEEALVNGYFDYKEFIELVTEKMRGLPGFIGIKLPACQDVEDIEVINPEKRKKMLEAVKKDLTFSSLFGGDRELLPVKLKKALEPYYPEILGLLPKYKEAAMAVTSQNPIPSKKLPLS